MSDSGKNIYAADGDNNTDRWSFRTGHHTREFGSGARVAALKYSDGILASWLYPSYDIHLWDTNNPRFLRTLRVPTEPGYAQFGESLSFSANRSAPYLAVTGSEDIYIFNVQSGALLDTIDEDVYQLALNNDGTLLACTPLFWPNNLEVYRRVGAAAPAATPQAALPPAVTTLLSNYPNPFNPETWIPYQLATPAEVTVSIHAADGKLVRALALGQLPAGVYQDKERAAYWDGTNEQGEPVASGVYFYTLKAGDFSATKKMLIRK